MKVKWKRYEYIHTSIQGENSVKIIELREDKIFVVYFLRKFYEEIYKYTKHSHRSRWKELQFKKNCEFFPIGTILSVIDFAENYTFVPQKEI